MKIAVCELTAREIQLAKTNEGENPSAFELPSGGGLPALLDKAEIGDFKRFNQIGKVLKPRGKFTPERFFSALGIKPEAVDAMAGVMSGIGFSFGIPVPDFAKKASKQMWRHLFGRDYQPNESIHDAGLTVGLLEIVAEDPRFIPKAKLQRILYSAVKPFVSLLRNCASKLGRKKEADFYNGRAKADEIFERMKNPDIFSMIKSLRVYVVIAACWKQFEQFQYYAEATRFLREKEVVNNTYSDRELMLIFEKVGLPKGLPGRPKALLPEKTES